MPYTVKEKTCANCGKKFFASKPRVKTCSQSCGAKDRCKRGLFSNKPKPIKWVENWKPALKANLDSPCHECTSHARNEEGYIYVMRNHKPIGLHRFLYEERNGKIPKGLVVRHRCDNPSCINPDHAILGTHADNTKDKVMRFRVYRPTGRKNPNAKITEAQVKKIFLDKELSNSVLADRYNLTRSTIHRIKKGIIWKSVTSKIAILFFLLLASVASAQWNKDLYDYGTKSNDTVYLAGTSFQHYLSDGDTAFCHVFGYPVSDSEEFAYCIYKSSPNIFIINSVVYNYYGTTAAVSFPSVSGVVSVTVEYKYNYPELIQLELGAPGSGTVTSVGLSLPGIFSISGSPVTTSGTLTATLASQTANKVWASPNGSSGAPTFRALVATDIPSLSYEPVITAGTTGQYWRGDKAWQTLNAAAVGLGNVTNNLQLTAANNLSDLVSTSTARTNLGLGSSATHASSDYFLVANNLSEGTAATMRTNLGLGTSAVQNVSYFLQTANNLSDVTASTARTNLGLGTSATHAATDFAASGANTDITSVLLNQTGLAIKGGDANALTIKPNETMTAARTLNLKVNDVSRTIDLSGNLTVSSAATISGTNTGDVTKSGENYLSLSGQAFTANAVDLSGTNATGILAAARFPALTGDVTTSSGAIGTTIANNVVTLAKMATVSTATILGRNTAGTGNVESLTTIPTGVLPAFSGGDVTSSAGSLTLTIGSATVTLAKMANMATSSLIYRRTAGTGVPEVNTLAQLKTDLVLVKADVGLGSVENTALSTWPGTTNITTVGTLASPTLTTPVINGLATGTGIASAATASTIVTRDASANVTANNWIGGYRTTATAAATTTLTVTDTYLQYFTGSTTQTVALPAVSTLALGHQFVIVNNSSGAVTVNSSGGNAVIILAGSTSAIVTSIATSGTDQTVWSVSYAADNVTTAKKLSVSNTLTLAGTDGTTMTFPSTSATIARTDAANTFTGVQTMTSPNFTTPVLGTPTSGNLANCTFPTLNQSTTGSAATLTTARLINGTSFNGSADITVTAAANTLTGSTLASGVTGSSLTSFGSSIALGTPASGTLTNCTFPTLNQNTTGSAAKWTTARTINGLSVDGSANASGNFTAGGTGSGFTVDLANSTMSGVLPIVNGGELRNTAATSATTGSMTVTMNTRYVTITPTGACTFNASGGVQGQTTTFFISTSGASSFTLTWGTNFKTTGTLATGTTTAKQFLVTFTCVNGTQWNEMARTTAE